MYDLFNGLFNLDGKFWNTIIPLITNPGDVSLKYISGKRQQYSNPFRFYLTVSILFFLILSASSTIDKYKKLQNGLPSEEQLNVKNAANTERNLDSLKTVINTELKNAWTPIDSIKREEIINNVIKKASDTTENYSLTKNKLNFGSNYIENYFDFQKKHPTISVDNALDSLKQEKTFVNRFLYDRAKTIHRLIEEENSQQQFKNLILSYSSISLFVLLPIFTLFLKLLYIRKKKQYVDHLIFVFHTQTVFFMLLSIYALLDILLTETSGSIFIVLFLIYLFMALKKFYKQGLIKTFLKFFIILIIYFSLAIVGAITVLLISFFVF